MRKLLIIKKMAQNFSNYKKSLNKSKREYFWIDALAVKMRQFCKVIVWKCPISFLNFYGEHTTFHCEVGKLEFK